MGVLIRKLCNQRYIPPQVLVICAVLFMVWLISYNTTLDQKADNTVYRVDNAYKDIPFLVVMCEGSNGAMTSEKVTQAKMMLKSAAALTNQILKFTIFSDKESIYEDIVSSMSQWPLDYQLKLQVEFHPVSYPPETDDFRLACKPCQTFRLLFADLLQHLDAAAYVDTDVIFMQPPEKMLKEFENFDDVQIAAFSEPSFVYMKQLQKRFQLPGSNGVNSGVGLFNFTRIRALPGKNFTQKSMDIFQEHRSKIIHSDQMILYIFFRKNPSLLFTLSCDWNYYNGLCLEVPSNCKEADTNGASLVHGGGGSFNTQLKFIWTAWDEYELGKPIQELISKIESNLEKYTSSCKATNITSIITKRLALLT